MAQRVNYLNNRDIMEEIHKSKSSFSSFIKPEYHRYDIILLDITEINETTLLDAKKNRAKRIAQQDYDYRKNTLLEKIKLSECEVNIDTIDDIDIIFRIMTFDHIPFHPGRKKTPKTIADHKEKLNFPPFQHWKFNNIAELECVGKSHWKDDVHTGYFSKTHGQITNKLGDMYIKLCERYSTRGNIRNYCVDTETEALTMRGWLDIDHITEDDTILSYTDGNMKWSSIESIYRGNYNGNMHHLTNRGIDALITPEHKMVTDRGLIKAEYLKETDRLVLMGSPMKDTSDQSHPDAFVELIGWMVTEGCYNVSKTTNKIGNISIHQNPGLYADRIRNCLESLNIKFSESTKSKCIKFDISIKDCDYIINMFPDKNLTMDFICSLTEQQRDLLLNTMIDGDGWRHNGNMRYCQKSKEHVDTFLALCAISGRRGVTTSQNIISFEKPTTIYNINLYSPRNNVSRVENIDFHGGKRNGMNTPGKRKGKIMHPNVPTTFYDGRVWCPKTEYGCFVARRNGKMYITGNTYVDELIGQAVLQLVMVGLQFDEYQSSNPFAYLTSTLTNAQIRVLNVEKRNQVMRDELLEINGLSPSFTRVVNYEHEYSKKRETDYQESLL